MARPYWTGTLQISLVSFGISLFGATETKNQLTLHQISRTTGERIRQQRVLESTVESRDAGGSVEKDDIVKAYEYRKGQYVTIEPGEFGNLRIPSKHTITISQFVDASELRPEFFEKPYFVAPENDMQAESFDVVRRALVHTAKAAIGKFATSGRESIVAIVPPGETVRGMMAYTIRYASELRDQNEYFRDIPQPKIDAASVELAETLIGRMSGKFDLNAYEDGYARAIKALVEAKVNNIPIPIEAAPPLQISKVISLAEALRMSLGENTPSKKKPPTPERRVADGGLGRIKAPGKPMSKRKLA